MKYSEELLKDEWRIRREEILTRDLKKCQNCGWEKAKTVSPLAAVRLNDFLNRYPIQLKGISESGIDYTIRKVDVESDTIFQILELAVSPEFAGKCLVDHGFSDNTIRCHDKETLFSNDLMIGVFGYYPKHYQRPKNIKKDLWAWAEEGGSLLNPQIFNESRYPNYRESSRKNCLHVHHKSYKNGKRPWEYPDENLITLCNMCHSVVHATESIPIYSARGIKIDDAGICDRCGGEGYIPEYSHVQNGVCFECWGEGISTESLEVIEG